LKIPKLHTICPITSIKLELKDLILLKFTRAIFKGSNFIDPITKDPLTNRSSLVCIRPTGDVILSQTYKMIIEPVGNYEGHMLEKSDVIVLKKGGTGFIHHDGNEIIASKHTMLGLEPRLTDFRGQHSGSGVKSGLVLF